MLVTTDLPMHGIHQDIFSVPDIPYLFRNPNPPASILEVLRVRCFPRQIPSRSTDARNVAHGISQYKTETETETYGQELLGLTLTYGTFRLAKRDSGITRRK